MNELITAPGRAVATPSNNPFLDYGNTQGGLVVGKLLRFNKFGEFKAGEEGEDIPYGTKMVAHVMEFYRGWFKWVDNKPVEQVIGRVADDFKPPSRHELGDLDKTQWDTDDKGMPRDPWQETNILILMDEASQLYTFSTASKGGIEACKKVMKAYGQRQAMHPNEFPVVALGMSSYDHPNKAYGQIRKPTFEVVSWVDRELIDNVLQGGGEAPAPAPAPAQPAAQVVHAQAKLAKPQAAAGTIHNATATPGSAAGARKPRF